MQDQILMVPFFNAVFRQPAPFLVEMLNVIRKRVSLPELPAGLEPFPGQWGLHTPGYYILALHFRRVPLGFEPSSVELNVDSQRKWRLQILEDFWHQVEMFAQQARAIATCR